MFGGSWILGLILIILAVYFLIKYFNENKGNSNKFTSKDNAIEILRERYASGEISEEEYKNKLDKLKEQ